MAGSTIYPLYNSTYTTFRVSPLYHGNTRGALSAPPLSDRGLEYHAKQLRDILTNKSIRGVDVAQEYRGYADDLQDCSWSLLGNEDQWENEQSDSNEPSLNAETARGIYIQLRYQRNTHCALLLRDPNQLPKDHPQFTTLPLLLLRMPAPVRNVFLNYLQLNFDCNVSTHNLHSIDASLERFMSTLSRHSASWSHFTTHPSLAQILRHLQIQLAFPSVAPLLKNIDITIAAEDIVPFLEQGEIIAAQQSQLQQRPFIAALSHYLDKHCGLRLDQAGIQISKVVCGVFALSADGKVKIFAPTRFEPDVTASSADVDELPRTPIQVALDELYSQLVAQVMPPSKNRDKVDATMDDTVGNPTAQSSTWQTEREEKARPDVVDLVGQAQSPVKRLLRPTQTQPIPSDMPESPPPPYALHDMNVGGHLVE